MLHYNTNMLDKGRLVWWGQTGFVSFFHFIRTYSLYRGDSLCQFWIALHCTSVRLPLPSSNFSPAIPFVPHLKQLLEISLFYFIYEYGAYQPYSLTLISSIHHPCSHNHIPHCTYFTVLSLIFNSKVNVRFLNVSQLWIYFVLVISTPSVTLCVAEVSHTIVTLG
jgi:hypothetical protein